MASTPDTPVKSRYLKIEREDDSPSTRPILKRSRTQYNLESQYELTQKIPCPSIVLCPDSPPYDPNAIDPNPDILNESFMEDMEERLQAILKENRGLVGKVATLEAILRTVQEHNTKLVQENKNLKTRLSSEQAMHAGTKVELNCLKNRFANIKQIVDA